MISGSDIVLQGRSADGEGAFIVSQLRETWPDLVVQEASSDSAVGAHDALVAGMREFFVYGSRADFDSWTDEGASAANADTMIHVMLGDDSTTVVTAEPPSLTYRLGFALRDSILSRRLLAQLQARNLPEGADAGSARRFRELLSDLILDLPDGEHRMEAFEACWRGMTAQERRDSWNALTTVAPAGSTGVALEDLAVDIGQRAPTRRAA